MLLGYSSIFLMPSAHADDACYNALKQKINDGKYVTSSEYLSAVADSLLYGPGAMLTSKAVWAVLAAAYEAAWSDSGDSPWGENDNASYLITEKGGWLGIKISGIPWAMAAMNDIIVGTIAAANGITIIATSLNADNIDLVKDYCTTLKEITGNNLACGSNNDTTIDAYNSIAMALNKISNDSSSGKGIPSACVNATLDALKNHPSWLKSVNTSDNIVYQMLTTIQNKQEDFRSVIGSPESYRQDQPVRFIFGDADGGYEGTSSQTLTYRVSGFFLFKLLGVVSTSPEGMKQIHMFVFIALLVWSVVQALAAYMQGGAPFETFLSILTKNMAAYFIGGAFVYYIMYLILTYAGAATISQTLFSYEIVVNRILGEFAIMGSSGLLSSVVFGFVIFFVKFMAFLSIANMIANIIFASLLITTLSSIVYVSYPLIWLQEIPGLRYLSRIVEGMFTKLLEGYTKMSIIAITLPIFGSVISKTLEVVKEVMVNGFFSGIGYSIFAILFLTAAISLINKLFAQLWQDMLKLA